MSYLFKSITKTYPKTNKEQFQIEILNINYARTSRLSLVILVTSIFMYLTTIFIDDLQIIKIILLLFMFSSVVIWILFIIFKPKIQIFNRKYMVLVFLSTSSILLLASSLLALAPNRYEMIGIYSLVILSISTLLYVKWYQNLIVQMLSLLYIFVVNNLFSTDFFSSPVFPKITIIIVINIFAFALSRLSYLMKIENFELRMSLQRQNEKSGLDLILKSDELIEEKSNKVKDLLDSLNFLLNQYTPYTKGHCDRVARLSRSIAENLALSADEITDCYWSALIHDIGKILVPAEILNKPSSLTKEEFDTVKKHPIWAYNVLKDSPSLNRFSNNVLHHHERWDGGGYPDGLKGDKIPIISQIISVADAVDAMTTIRPYRGAMSLKTAIQVIIDNSGTQFSPKIVASFLNVITQIDF